MAKAETRRIEIVQACAVYADHCDVGDVIDVEDDTARELILIGRAKAADKGAALLTKAKAEAKQKGKPE